MRSFALITILLIINLVINYLYFTFGIKFKGTVIVLTPLLIHLIFSLISAIYILRKKEPKKTMYWINFILIFISVIFIMWFFSTLTINWIINNQVKLL